MTRMTRMTGYDWKVALLIALGILLAVARNVHAQEVTPLHEGEPAPFTGLLFSHERALKLGDRAERCEFKLHLNEQLFVETLKLREDAAAASADIRVEGAEERVRIALEAAQAAEERAVREWWDQPGLLLWAGAGAGAVVGAGLVIGSVFLVSELRVGTGR